MNADEDDLANHAALVLANDERVPALPPAPTSSTLLPYSVASVISLATRTSSFSLRLGSLVGSLAVSGAKAATLTGLELSRAFVEGLLSRAGSDVADRSIGALGRESAEGLLERSLQALHSTITHASFLASTGFNLTSTAITGSSALTQQLLYGFDAVLGDTESSRAVASIITLVRREYQNPQTGISGERVSVADLAIAALAFAVLQRWGQRRTAKEIQDNHGELTIWDVVILNNGRRADVSVVRNRGIISRRQSPERRPHHRRRASFVSATGGPEVLETEAVDLDDPKGTYLEIEDASEAANQALAFRQQVMSQLKPGASVTIKSVTTDYVTIDVAGDADIRLQPPPGYDMVGEEVLITSHRYMFQSRRKSSRNITAEEIERYQEQRQRVPDFAERLLLPEQEDASVDIAAQAISHLGSLNALRITSRPSSFELPRKELTQGATKHVSIVHDDQPPTNASPSAKAANQAIPRSKLPRLPWRKGEQDQKASKSPSSDTMKRNASGSTLFSLGSKKTSQPLTPQSRDSSEQSKKRSNRGPGPLPSSPEGNHKFPKRTDTRGRNVGHAPLPTINTYAVRERRSDSIVSDAISIHSVSSSRSVSPVHVRTPVASSTMAQSYFDKTVGSTSFENLQHARGIRNQSMTSLSPYLSARTPPTTPGPYKHKGNNSESSLVLSRPHSAKDRDASIASLYRTGSMLDQFPYRHFVSNLTRFARFSSASYGSNFLRYMGISSDPAAVKDAVEKLQHHEHHSFSTHTRLPASTILLSSFVDTQGGSNAAGETDTGVPLVHYVSVDQDSKAVVLTCRGTLGFEDVLTDMTCDYDDLHWEGKVYRVHKGMHASARRLLQGKGGRVLEVIKAALEDREDYGLILCGHSLGGGVAALLAILLAERVSTAEFSTATFVTRNYNQLALPSASHNGSSVPRTPPFKLPPGRRIHVFAYGPPATVSPSLQHATRGLITTVINNHDLVPYLSLGTLHDMQAAALAFKIDTSGAKGEMRKRMWETLTTGIKNRWYGGISSDYWTAGIDDLNNDEWAWSALKSLRASMLNPKLMPPGEIFVVETTPVLQRDAFVGRDEPQVELPRTSGTNSSYPILGRPAIRAQLIYVKDVMSRFREVRFGSSMFADHSPRRYEVALAALERGVCPD